jgi:hypothetical protein
MAKKIARILKTDMLADIDVPGLAQLLQRMGRKGDTVLAHITPKEARKLKKEGGSGTKNPDTGLPEFYDGEDNLGQVDPGQFPELYAGGELPQAGQETTYSPGFVPDVQGGGQGGQFETVPTYQPTQEAAVPFEVPAAQQAAIIPSAAPLPTALPGYAQPEMEALRQPDTLGGYIPKTPEEKSFLDKLQLTPQQKLQIALGLGGGIANALVGQRGLKQAQQAKREISDIGAPYRQQGQEMIAAAQRGELTPVGQQTLQAARARLAQDVTRRGGAGAQQTETQLANLRNNLLQQQYQYGLRVASIGDQYAAKAIQTGLTQDAEMAKLMQQLASSIGGIFGSQPGTK